MKKHKWQELPEILRTYIRGFLGMGAVVAVLSVITMVLWWKER